MEIKRIQVWIPVFWLSGNQAAQSLLHPSKRQGEELKVRLTSPPVEGEANRLCVEFIAKTLKVSKSTVELVAGEKSRHKRLLIRGGTVEDVRRAFS